MNINYNLSEILKILDNIKQEKLYSDDIEIINDTYDNLEKILNKDGITKENLDAINENIKYLDINYDDLFDLVNYYDPIYIYYKNMLRKKYVDELRNKNKEKFKKEIK